MPLSILSHDLYPADVEFASFFSVCACSDMSWRVGVIKTVSACLGFPLRCASQRLPAQSSILPPSCATGALDSDAGGVSPSGRGSSHGLSATFEPELTGIGKGGEGIPI